MRALVVVVIVGACAGAPAPEPKPATGRQSGDPFCDQIFDSLQFPLGNYVRMNAKFADGCVSSGTEEEPRLECATQRSEASQTDLLSKCLRGYRFDHDDLLVAVEWPNQPKREVRIVVKPTGDTSSTTFTLEPLPVVAATPTVPTTPTPPTPRPPPSPPDERFVKLMGKEWRGTSETLSKDDGYGGGPKVMMLHALTLRLVDGDQVTGTLENIRKVDGRSYTITYVVSGELYNDRKQLRLKTYNRVKADELPSKNDGIGWCGYTLELSFADTFKGKPIPPGIFKLDVAASNICKHPTNDFEFVIMNASGS